jgi:hypothetical protein
MTVVADPPVRSPRGGEPDAPLAPRVWQGLGELVRELETLRSKAMTIGDDFVAFLISTAADEVRDQLRDDLILRQELVSEAGPNSVSASSSRK